MAVQRPIPAHAPVALPEGVLWRRAETQLSTRLGLFPGDKVAVLAPAERDPMPTFGNRLPRIKFVQVGTPGGVFGWREASDAARVVADPLRPPFEEESLEAVVLLFAGTLLSAKDHARLVDAWAPVLYPFGKWLELLAVEGPRDPRLVAGESHLSETGFEKVRSMRLALGRMGSALYLQSGRWPGLDDDADDEEE